jgi:hypothetical protein
MSAKHGEELCVRVLRGSLIASLGLAATSVEAQSRPTGIIDGIVTDTNLVSLDHATVSIIGSPVRVATGENGRFRIVALHAGSYVIAVHRIGYVPLAVALSVADGDTLRPSFALRQVVTALDTMVVSVKPLATRLSEFEDRRKLGFGHFITAEEIEKRNEVYVADVIRREPSVGIDEHWPFAQVAVNMRGDASIIAIPGPCPFQLFLDGVPMPPGTNLMNLPPPRDLAGIEIYSGPATIPLQYKYGTASCGVILFWTKSG